MKIETKYDVEQIVWPIFIDDVPVAGDLRWHVIGEREIERMTLEKNRNEWDYYADGWYPESDLFPTSEDAQAECDRRNAEAK